MENKNCHVWTEKKNITRFYELNKYLNLFHSIWRKQTKNKILIWTHVCKCLSSVKINLIINTGILKKPPTKFL